MKEYSINRAFKMLPWLRVFLESIPISIVLSLGVFLIRFEKFTLNRYELSTLILIVLYHLYKICITPTPVYKIIFDYENELLIINYHFLYVKKQQIHINFNELTYFTSINSLYFGNTLSIRIYKKNKFKIKLNAHNGWNNNQITEILAEIEKFGKKSKPPWYYF